MHLNPNLTCKHHCTVNRNERFGIHPRTKQMPIFTSWWQAGRAERGHKTLYKRALTYSNKILSALSARFC